MSRDYCVARPTRFSSPVVALLLTSQAWPVFAQSDPERVRTDLPFVGQPAVAKQTQHQEGAALSPSELARRYRAAMCEANFLRLEGTAVGVRWTISDDTPHLYQVRFRQEMDPHHLKLTLMTESADTIVSVLYEGGLVREYWPGRAPPTAEVFGAIKSQLEEWKVRNYRAEQICESADACGVLATYTAPTVDGQRIAGAVDLTIPDERLIFGQLCLVGSSLTSWLSPTDDVIDTIAGWIAEGEVLAPRRQSISGRECITVLWREVRPGLEADPTANLPAAASSESSHLLFLDAKTYHLVRWDPSLRTFGRPWQLYSRSKKYERIVAETHAPQDTWTLAIPGDAERKVLYSVGR